LVPVVSQGGRREEGGGRREEGGGRREEGGGRREVREKRGRKEGWSLEVPSYRARGKMGFCQMR
jgi:hypothetical protein